MSEDNRIPPASPPRSGWRLLLLFLLGLVVLDVLVISKRRTWETYSPDDYTERVRGCRTRRPDVIVAGGSPVAEGFNPSLLAGLRCNGSELPRAYNLGLPGGTTSDVYHAVLRVADRPPRVLIYGITATDLNDARFEPHGPDALLTWKDWLTWVRESPESSSWATRHFLRGQLAKVWSLSRYRNGIRLWAAMRVERLVPGTFPELAKQARFNISYVTGLRQNDGYSPMPGFAEARLDHRRTGGNLPERFHFMENYRLGSHLRFLHRLIDWSQRHNVALVLVDMPVSPDLEEKMYPDQFRRYREVLREVGQTRGVPILWASRQNVGLEDRHLADLIHLNREGAAILSRWVRRQLEDCPSPGEKDLSRPEPPR